MDPKELTIKLGLEFNSLEEAYLFWTDHGGMKGFGVRKKNSSKSKKDGSITHYKYVCCKEGVRQYNKRFNEKYKVIEFFDDHNHPLHPPETVHMLACQRRITENQAYELEVAEDVGIQQKTSFDLMSKYVGGRENLGYTRQDAKNYLNSKRRRDMAYGEAGCLLQYFQQQLIDNPSFFHAYQIDSEEQITNIFWADARMLFDYQCFGDEISLDTTYCTNGDHRPLAIFSGFNHYRGGVIFGAALLYDETVESFKWLLETFLQTHSKKRPQTIFTDQDQAMSRALQEVILETKHGLCTWHIMKNGIKHLGNLMKDGSNFLSDLKKCMYDNEEETNFEASWRTLLLKYNVEENTWLNSTYQIKEKWAACYMKYAFTLGMRSTQLSESINSYIKSCIRPNLNINQFFKQFERIVKEKRYETKHGLCTWHIMKNGIKHLGNLMKDGSNFLSDFKKCMYDNEEETNFEASWRTLLLKYNVEENTWLNSTYQIKEKWVARYMKYAFTLGKRSTQLSESINSDIKSCISPNLNINQFFKQFERIVKEKRYSELKQDYEMRKKLPRMIIQSSPMIRQLSQEYTPPMFNLFQREWDLIAATNIYKKKKETEAHGEYVITMESGELVMNPKLRMEN
ncbi:Protein FAR1-RELATED SEQUENCE 5 [Glycine max]|nr:Protein FAR1-RELATED SEQUENCE 5 [Glycine max]